MIGSWNVPTLRHPAAFSERAAAAVLVSRLYAIAGNRFVGAGLSYTRVVEVYDSAWARITSIPSGR